jgi:hypothetical protein
MVRRAVVLGVGVIVAILLIVGIKACRDSAHKNSLRDYDRAVSSLLSDSRSRVSRPLFALLQGASSRSTACVPRRRARPLARTTSACPTR